jgi:hypothetical protein
MKEFAYDICERSHTRLFCLRKMVAIHNTRQICLIVVVLGLIASAIGVSAQGGGEGLTIGFSQIGSESAWRTAPTIDIGGPKR